MWTTGHGGNQRTVRVVLVILFLLVSYLAILPDSLRRAEGVWPTFTRPNVLIDKGIGSVQFDAFGGPDIASDEHGMLHAVWSDNRSGYDEGIYYSHSYDGGISWRDEKRIDYYLGLYNSGPDVEVDVSGGKYSGNIYVAWQFYSGSMAEIYVIRSTDGGTTWTNKHRVDTSPSDVGSLAPVMAVDMDGSVYIAFQDRRWSSVDIFITRSDDGGVTWTLDERVPTGAAHDSFPDMVAFGGSLYLAWIEASPYGTKIWLATSNDKGESWTSNVAISVPATEGDILHAALAVDSQGTIHAAWVSRDTRYWSFVVYSKSENGGLTWTQPVNVSDAYPDANITQSGVNIISSLGVIYVTWAENRNGDYDIFASWSEDGGRIWGDGLFNDSDRRVDDTDANGVSSDDESMQYAPSATAGPAGIYVVWVDRRIQVANHLYFAAFEPSEILITEVRDAPDGLEQIEVHNPLNKDADVSGWGLMIDSTRIDLTPLSPIPAGAYRTIGDPPSSNLRVDISLGDEGGSIVLLNRWDYYKDKVSYGQLGPAPDPLESESVWRVASIGAGDSTWTRTPSPTMGGKNAGRLPISNPNIVLNEVLFNSANPDQLFVELYYRGKGTIDLAGYTLVGDTPFTLSSTVLGEGRRLCAIRSLQAPTLFSMANPLGDNLYLYDHNGSLLDMVGWSSSHTQGKSMSRVPDGFGGSTGYDDTSSIDAGWRFDQIPTPPRVLIGPEQGKSGDPGDKVFYVLFVTNEDYQGAYVNLQSVAGLEGWVIALLGADGITPLTDSPGDADSTPDVGYLQPSQMVTIQVAVSIPASPPDDDWEESTVKAWSASDPQATDTVHLQTSTNPYVEPRAFVNPSSIWVESAPANYQPKETTLSLSVRGRGNAIVNFKPQDTVLMIDSSGSMENNDPHDLRKYASRLYVDLLSPPDRAAVVDFDTDAVLVNDEHLTSDYIRVKSNIDLIDHYGWTNLSGSIRVATDELLNYGNKSHVFTEILMTDGADTMGNPPQRILAEARRAASAGIMIYTIGLINGGEVDEQILKDIAAATGGRYLAAWTPEDLIWIYGQIGREVRMVAGYDRDITDNVPMVNVYLPSYISVVPGSISRNPDFIRVTSGWTNIQWNVSRINIGEGWWSTFRITSEISGPAIRALSEPETKLTYVRFDDSEIAAPFPDTFVEVKSPAPPPSVRYTITKSPEIGIVIVDKVDYPAPHTFVWVAGETHTISCPDTEPIAPRERYAFSAWDDHGSLTHDITVGSSDKTLTAIYSHQFEPRVTILGLNAAHTISNRYSSRAKMVHDEGLFDSWTGWVDEGTALSFDLLGSGSEIGERRVSLEYYGNPPWISVISPFDASILYWHQVMPTVVIQGLPASSPAHITLVSFGVLKADLSWASWSNWVDHGSNLTVTGRVDITNRERYINTISRELQILEWTVVSPYTYVVPFIHQFKPIVELHGLDPGNCVSAHFKTFGSNSSTSENCESWSDWVDAGSDLSFDALSSGSGSTERWITRTDFTESPWSDIASGFTGLVDYWHQYAVVVVFEGLPLSVAIPIHAIQFGSLEAFGAYGQWAGWVDNGTTLIAVGKVLIQPDERYINKISFDADYLRWTVVAPTKYVIPFLHQFRPTVHLIGTDAEHSVNVSYTDSSESEVPLTSSGISGQWKEWVDEGMQITFSDETTGNPPYEALNQTVFISDSAFTAYIVYTSAGTPPNVGAINLKPIISLLFASTLVLFGILCGHRRPLDISLPKLDPDAAGNDTAMSNGDIRSHPMGRKSEMPGIDALKRKFSRDRLLTIALLSIPVASLEGVIGLASLLTGAMRVPDCGNWLCIGLVLNSTLLIGGIILDLMMQRHGYAVPEEMNRHS